MNASASNSWLRPAMFAAILGGLIFAAFPDVVLGWRTFCFRDFGHFAYPMACYQRECFWRGELPLWNPLNNCGIPFLAQWNTLTLYPPALFYLLLPLSWSLGVFCLLHLFWGGLGAYHLALRWTGSRLGASVAGVVFALNGFSLNALMWPALTATLAWMPWVVLCGERACREGGRRIVVAALVGAMQMLTGTPEFILLTWLLLGAVVAVPAWRERGAKSWLQSLMRFGFLVALVAGLSAAQLLPFLELLAHSQRSAGFANADWSMPASGLANLFAPAFHTYPTSHDVRLQFDQQWTSSYYLGVATLGLAAFAMWKQREPRMLLLAASAGAAVLLSLGDHGLVHPLLRKIIPQLGLMRFPIKFFVVTALCLPLLAAYGMGRLEERKGASRHAVIVGSIGLTLIVAGIIAFDFIHPLHPEYSSLSRDTLFNGLFRLLWLALAAMAILKLTASEDERSRRVAGFALLVFIAADLLSHTPRQNPTIALNAYAPNMVKMPAAMQPGEHRAMISPLANRTLYERPAPDLREDFLRKRLALFSNFNLLENVAKVNGFFPLYLQHERDVWSLLYEKTNLPAAGLKDFLGVAIETSPANFLKWETRSSALPLVTAGQRVGFETKDGVIRKMASQEFQAQAVVYLAPEALTSVSNTNAAKVRVTVSLYRAQELDLLVDADAPTQVVIAQCHYPAWQAQVDGKPATVLRANHAFQAVAVPAGKHEVKLVYRDRKFFLGVIITALTAAACVIWWIFVPRLANPAHGGQHGIIS